MGILLLICMAVGFLLSLIGSIMFLVAAFRVSVLWGLAVLFLSPFANIIFLTKYWYEAKQAFLLQLFGMLMVFAAIFSGMGQGMQGVRTKVLEHAPASIQAELVEKEEEAILRPPESVLRKPDERSREDYTGLTLLEVRNRLGTPPASMEANGVVTYYYPGMELVSKDGVTVTEQMATAE